MHDGLVAYANLAGRDITSKKIMSNQKEWRCEQCGKLLGKVTKDRLHIRYERGCEYFASLPVSSTCRKCGALNELVNITAN